ncbi:MAG: hypothetical protein IPP25_13230 [Saprospiraceae bacterium]|nr:hypothetical protein [Candidatus Opimibacter skivensis]
MRAGEDDVATDDTDDPDAEEQPVSGDPNKEEMRQDNYIGWIAKNYP